MEIDVFLIGIILSVILLIAILISVNINEEDLVFTVQHDGVERKYFVHVPSTYNANTPSALLINFHPGGGGAMGHASSTKMNQKASAENFIAVHPQGTRRDGETDLPFQYFWNIPAGINGAYYDFDDPLASVDDLGFTRKMLDELETNYNIDSDKIYFTGFSNGGIFAQYASCALTPRVKGVATVASVFTTFPANCNLQEPVPVLLFFNTDDICIPFNGGPSECGDVKQDRVFISARTTKDIWLNKNSCTTTSQIPFENGGTTCTTNSDCSQGSKVTFCVVGGAGHTWPGSDQPSLFGETSQDIDATNEMWTFFNTNS